MDSTCEACKKESDDLCEVDGKVLCDECIDKYNEEYEYDVCEICDKECCESDYAGCCNDGDCKFGREKMCYDCCKVDEETGVPVCLDCIKALKPKTKKIRTIRVPLCRLRDE